jgi:hypothetical protein
MKRMVLEDMVRGVVVGEGGVVCPNEGGTDQDSIKGTSESTDHEVTGEEVGSREDGEEDGTMIGNEMLTKSMIIEGNCHHTVMMEDSHHHIRMTEDSHHHIMMIGESHHHIMIVRDSHHHILMIGDSHHHIIMIGDSHHHIRMIGNKLHHTVMIGDSLHHIMMIVNWHHHIIVIENSHHHIKMTVMKTARELGVVVVGKEDVSSTVTVAMKWRKRPLLIGKDTGEAVGGGAGETSVVETCKRSRPPSANTRQRMIGVRVHQREIVLHRNLCQLRTGKAQLPLDQPTRLARNLRLGIPLKKTQLEVLSVARKRSLLRRNLRPSLDLLECTL